MKLLSKVLVSCGVFLMMSNFSFGQKPEITIPPSHIKSVIFKNQATNDFSPVVQLGQSFTFSFDDLQDEQQNYSYKIEHFNSDWEPSGLASTEYINGYATDRIRDFENSFNTFQNFTHYRLRIPNNNTRLKISGNYIITILSEEDEPLVSQAFMVYEPLVTAGMSLHKSKTIADLNTKHSIEAVVNYPNYRINNPNAEIKVVFLQNFDWNNQLRGFKPQYHRGTQLIYRQKDLTFSAGNEFYFFDTKEIRNPVNKIAKIELKDIIQTYLYTDQARANKPYTNMPDVNGNFYVRTIDNNDNRIEADYSKVYFALDVFEQLNEKNVYIYGNFNNWQLTEENKMKYNSSLGIYTSEILLKQGFYNYTYVAADLDGEIDATLIDGSFYQTENDYAIFVYHRPFGGRYDKIIGFGNANSQKLRN